jgi:hypothetical protein
LSTAAGKRDIMFLLADGGMEQVLRGFLGRDQFHRSLGCGKFEFDPAQDVIVAATKDPGVYGTAHELLRPYERTHQRAVVIVDADWSGSPGAAAIEEHISQRMACRWQEFAVIVIAPELEAWIMNENAHLARIFRCPENYRQILQQAGCWPNNLPKPPRPKEALEHLKKHHKVRVVYADFRKLVAVMSVTQCQDPAFNKLRDHLRVWFSEQP